MHTDLPVADIFDTPTITTLAHRIDTQAQPATIPPIQTLHTGTGTPLFCIHATSGISCPTKPSPPTSPTPSSASTKPSTPTKPHPTPSKPWPATTPPASKTPTPPAPYHLLGWSFGGVLAHQIAIELHHRGHTDTRLILLDSLPTLDTNTDPTITPPPQQPPNPANTARPPPHHHPRRPATPPHHQPQPQPQPQHHPLPTPPTPH
ncbi:thioesterase domain-containing protein, partial [Mycobacterium ulcerans]